MVPCVAFQHPSKAKAHLFQRPRCLNPQWQALLVVQSWHHLTWQTSHCWPVGSINDSALFLNTGALSPTIAAFIPPPPTADSCGWSLFLILPGPKMDLVSFGKLSIDKHPMSSEVTVHDPSPAATPRFHRIARSPHTNTPSPKQKYHYANMGSRSHQRSPSNLSMMKTWSLS